LRRHRLLVVPKAAAESDRHRHNDGASYQDAHGNPLLFREPRILQSFNQDDVTKEQQQKEKFASSTS